MGTGTASRLRSSTRSGRARRSAMRVRTRPSARAAIGHSCSSRTALAPSAPHTSTGRSTSRPTASASWRATMPAPRATRSSTARWSSPAARARPARKWRLVGVRARARARVRARVRVRVRVRVRARVRARVRVRVRVRVRLGLGRAANPNPNPNPNPNQADRPADLLFLLDRQLSK